MKILYVDDSGQDRNDFKVIVENLSNHSVITAKSGFEGLKLLDHSIDLIVTDHDMEGMNGVGFANEAKKIVKCPVLLASNHAEHVIERLYGGKMPSCIARYLPKRDFVWGNRCLIQKLEETIS